jgi:outer membrane receptor protein involved in Fe transport
MRRVENILLLLLAGTMSILAQEKVNPEMRSLEVTDSTSNNIQESQPRNERPLPKFDLPEFVITGVAATDLPKFDKLAPSADIAEPSWTWEKNTYTRDNETIELGVTSRDLFTRTLPLGSTGVARFCEGTFFSTQADVRSAYILPDMRFVFDGNYHRTKGFTDHTDQSGGGIDGTIHTILEPEMEVLRHTELDGGLGYQSEAYHLYGSNVPDRERTTSVFHLGTVLSNNIDSDHFVTAHVNFSTLTVQDSSSNTENQFQLGAQTILRAWDIPIDTRGEISITSHGVSIVDFSGRVNDLHLSDVFFQAALHLTWAKGTGQNIVRIKPQVFASYSLIPKYRLFVSYAPEVVPMSLSKILETNRYVSAFTAIQNQDITHAGELGVEALWTDDIRSRAAIRVHSISDYGVFTDSVTKGVWDVQYNGRATIVSFVIETFATLTRNDYFSSSFELQSLHHELYGNNVPYIPSLEFSGYYVHEFTPQISGILTAHCVGKRDADVNGTATLPAYLTIDMQGKYSVLNWLNVKFEIENLTNTKYDVWQGYQEFPFMLLAGCSVQW